MTIDAPHPLDFFAKLRWLDGRPLLDTIEPYRQAIFETVLYSLDGNRPQSIRSSRARLSFGLRNHTS